MTIMESRPGPRRVEPGPEGRDEVVAAVLDAATERFSARGPSRVSIREIADAANVNHALIHRHFHTKQELLRQVMARFILGAGEQIRPKMSWSDAVEPLFEPDPRHATWARMLAWLLLESDVDVALVERFPIVETLVEIAAEDGVEEENARVSVAAVVLMALGWQLFGDYIVEMADLGHLDREELVRRLGALAARMGPGKPH